MGLISFLFFQGKTAFNVNTCHVISNITFNSCFPLFDVDHLEIANCYNLTIVFYPLANFGQALCIRSCHEDLILTRKSHNCSGIAFIQGDSAGDSKLIEQTLPDIRRTGERKIIYNHKIIKDFSAVWNYGKLSAKFLVSGGRVIDTVGFLSFF